jgi:hypothetical protein
MNDGIIYLIQPTELISTNRYKIGCSRKIDLSRINDYNKGTRILCVMNCDKPFKLEKYMKLKFLEKFKLIGGKEYFEAEEKEMIYYFTDIVINHMKNNIIYENNEDNEDEQENKEENDKINKLKDFINGFYETNDVKKENIYTSCNKIYIHYKKWIIDQKIEQILKQKEFISKMEYIGYNMKKIAGKNNFMNIKCKDNKNIEKEKIKEEKKLMLDAKNNDIFDKWYKSNIIITNNKNDLIKSSGMYKDFIEFYKDKTIINTKILKRMLIQKQIQHIKKKDGNYFIGIKLNKYSSSEE